MDGDQRGHAAALRIDAPDKMPRTLGSNHHHVNVRRRNDRLEMNAETVGDAQNFSRMQIGLNELLVSFRLGFIGS